jgi:5-methylcytosine-specific restriction endonuclease McrA
VTEDEIAERLEAVKREQRLRRKGDQMRRWRAVKPVRVPDVGAPEERLREGRPKPTRSQRSSVIARDGCWCRYCGVAVVGGHHEGRRAPSNLLTIDHVTPRSRGGSNWANNRVVCCARCNKRKGTQTLEETGWELLPPRGSALVIAASA